MKNDIPQRIKDNPSIYIPDGLYCHGRASKIRVCPFWDLDKEKPEQQNGYCHYLKQGDWDFDYTGLLWDMCKECDINLSS